MHYLSEQLIFILFNLVFFMMAIPPKNLSSAFFGQMGKHFIAKTDLVIKILSL